jgi:hypothetical protein
MDHNAGKTLAQDHASEKAERARKVSTNCTAHDCEGYPKH